MKPIGIFYGTSTGMTEKVAAKIRTAFGKEVADMKNIREAKAGDILRYDFLVMGTSAWGIGDMQDDWENFTDQLAGLDLSGKRIALFGLGDQKKYPVSFADGLGMLFCRLPDKSGVTGSWPVTGYDYYFSSADKDGKFVGLVIDEINQADLTDSRVERWVSMLKKEWL